jgi:hypothetical protein
MFEISKGTPWYVRVDGNQVRREGIKVIAGAQGTSPGNGFVDLPSPVDFKTDNISVEGGYQTKTQQYALSYHFSKFSNDNQLLNWSNGFFSSATPLRLDTTVLPADNEFWRIGANATWKKLPYESTLAARLTLRQGDERRGRAADDAGWQHGRHAEPAGEQRVVPEHRRQQSPVPRGGGHQDGFVLAHLTAGPPGRYPRLLELVGKAERVESGDVQPDRGERFAVLRHSLHSRAFQLPQEQFRPRGQLRVNPQNK